LATCVRELVVQVILWRRVLCKNDDVFVVNEQLYSRCRNVFAINCTFVIFFEPLFSIESSVCESVARALNETLEDDVF
jgi:hypothetical protein